MSTRHEWFWPTVLSQHADHGSSAASPATCSRCRCSSRPMKNRWLWRSSRSGPTRSTRPCRFAARRMPSVPIIECVSQTPGGPIVQDDTGAKLQAQAQGLPLAATQSRGGDPIRLRIAKRLYVQPFGRSGIDGEISLSTAGGIRTTPKSADSSSCRPIANSAMSGLESATIATQSDSLASTSRRSSSASN